MLEQQRKNDINNFYVERQRWEQNMQQANEVQSNTIAFYPFKAVPFLIFLAEMPRTINLNLI